MSNKNAPLIVRAGWAAHLSYEGIAHQTGASRRSVQRWITHESWPMPAHYHALARVVHPRDPDLAAELARAGGSSLVELGIVRPPPPAPSPSLSPAITAHQADSVICAAAEVLNVPPSAVRPVVAAVFIRAHELGFSTEALARLFRGEKPGKAPPQSGEKKG